MVDNELEPVALEGQSWLAQLLNDSGKVITLGGKDYEIHALKPAVQWLIAEEATKIQKKENESFADVIKQFAQSSPAVLKCLTLAILNDKNKIYKEGTKEFSDEYNALYEVLQWETDPNEWLGALVEVINLLSLDSFFGFTNALKMLREAALGRKTRNQTEAASLLRERNTGK